MTDPLVEAESITKIFRRGTREVTALSRVSLQLHRGEMLAVQGPSGSGKTTLLMILAGLLQPTSGQLVWAGENRTDVSRREWDAFRRQHLGFVFQSFHLLPYLSVGDNVCLAADDALSTRERARNLLVDLGLESRVGHLPSELSVGEQQRAALARALISRPTCVLADEPTGNLDSVATAQVLNFLKAFAEQGGTVVLVTHDDQVAGQCHRRLCLRDGRISADG